MMIRIDRYRPTRATNEEEEEEKDRPWQLMIEIVFVVCARAQIPTRRVVGRQGLSKRISLLLVLLVKLTTS